MWGDSLHNVINNNAISPVLLMTTKPVTIL